MKNILLGTDWWSDCDDAVALRLITRGIKAGNVRLLGVGINACMEYSVASLVGFLRADGIEGVPVGIDLAGTDFLGSGPYQKRLALNYAPDVNNSLAEDAVRLYRRVLAEATEKVEILEVGFLQVIANLLKSLGDDISPMSGLELVRQKVSKVWCMAGKWDEDGGFEHNFCNNLRSAVAAKDFCELCPVPVTFLGWEVGNNVISGGELNENDHLHRVLVDHGSPMGRHSWDPMLVQMALIGDEERAGYQTVLGTASVEANTGANHFLVDDKGNHKFVVKVHENDYYAAQINQAI